MSRLRRIAAVALILVIVGVAFWMRALHTDHRSTRPFSGALTRTEAQSGPMPAANRKAVPTEGVAAAAAEASFGETLPPAAAAPASAPAVGMLPPAATASTETSAVELLGTARTYAAHAPLREAEFSDPNSAGNRAALATMVNKALSRAAQAASVPVVR